MSDDESRDELHSLLERSRRLRHAVTQLREEVARQGLWPDAARHRHGGAAS